MGRIIAALAQHRLAAIEQFAGTSNGLASYVNWQAEFRRDFDPSQTTKASIAQATVARKARYGTGYGHPRRAVLI